MPNTKPQAHFDATLTTVEIEGLALRDKDVAHEAQRWTSGERGPVIYDPDTLRGADLTEFVTEAIKMGAHALSVTGAATESHRLEQMLKEVGEKAADSTSKAAEVTERAVESASETLAKAAADAKKAITEAGAASRNEFTQSVAVAKHDLNTEVRRIFGGENPELLDRLQPVLDKFGASLDAKAQAGTNELLTRATKQFDPSDPTSPMSKHAAELGARQQQLVEMIGKNHADLARKVDELTTALKVQEAKASLAKVTPIKGDTFENQVNAIISEIAAGLGDEFTDTRTIVGSVPRSKKGDAVLTIDGGSARVVIETTDSSRTTWAEYFNEAERNRLAAAALGIVRSTEQNGGQSIRVLGSRRIVLAFDPGVDDPDLIRTVVMLLRTAALTAATRRGANQLVTAEEKITEAIERLTTLDDVKKTAGSIQKSATKIENSCTGITSGIQRLLTDALTALHDASPEAHADLSTGSSSGEVA
ncbi:Fis family transcriptional regulator [Mycobacterium szulgai]|uniref:Fis family transcriptional regulator n=1 Tax=Mycobacterium szulgai TaxID=1787 RepID=A0A1X2DHU4_MYCSZ|nr:Fis family transcriptional regulator [Mycobacterium szulgai]MCV7078835.1 Fis family transcriptional regulator [Mycobacterium szulgai]ORW87722.1 Fis family transcriptional regulator [Mycobacterium szulgai]